MPHSRSTSHTSSHHETLSSPNQRTPLLHHSSSSHTQRNAYHRPSCQQEDCEHEALSPYASRPNSSSSTRPPTSRNDSNGHTPTYLGSGYQPQASDAPHLSDNSFGGKYGGESDLRHGILGDAVADGVLGDGTGGSLGQEGDGANEGGEECGALAKDRWKGVVAGMSTTQYLARSHDVKGRRTMYLAYYFPLLQWITQYRWRYLQGDLIAALTMASFYIPMSLSYASNLGHIPPINGLYSFVFNPLIYAFLGSCPQMVVGPEAAGSLLVGNVVRSSVDLGNSGDEDDAMNAAIAGVVTGMAGAVIFIAGLTRLGFLDSVLSRPFLRGFISAIGFVILVDQLIPETGLTNRVKHVGGVSHGSSLDKIIFLVENVRHAHGLTTGVAFGSFAIIMVCRQLKKYLQPRYPSVAYVPDRFLVVVLSAVFTWRFGWDKQGLEILGDVQSSSGSPFPFRFPFAPSHMKHIQEAMSTSFLIALLGFFESSVAAKSLGGGEGKHGEGIQGMSLSTNRELVALGFSNVVGGCFMALPAFGGYGRSKVNASTGGKTPMSSVILSLITVICVLFLLPYFYYLPKAVLSAMISVVAYSLIEEAPHDIRFFVHIRGWSELTLMFLIFAATIFYSLPLGIALGVGLSLLSVIRHSTKPRIQILGRVPGTQDQFENAEDNPQSLDFIDGCLIVKIPEPLTFANTGDLKNRLRRLELYGTTAAHPALPRVRAPEHNKNIIFDVHGVTSIDGSGTQVLKEIVDSYIDRGERVFFCRMPKETSQVHKMFQKSGIVDNCGGPRHFLQSVDEALKVAEVESEVSSMEEFYRDHPEQDDG